MENLDFDFDFDFSFDEKETETEIVENYEVAVKSEMSETLKALKARAKEEEKIKQQNVSTDFWFAVYFASQEQRDKFLNFIGVLNKLEDQYIDAETFANAVGLSIDEQEIKIPKAFRKPKNIDDLIFDI
jgi:hypothetical protein